MYNRIRHHEIETKITTAKEAALLIADGMVVGCSGFTMAGYPKAVPMALARRAKKGDKVQITLITGASVGDELDGELARNGIIKRRYPYQTNNSIRDAINRGEIDYVDMHLSQVPFWIKNGYFGKIDIAIIEAIGIDDEGNIIPSTSIGYSNLLVEYAEKVIVEVNTSQPVALEGMHDVYSPRRVPETEAIPIVRANNRVGMPYIRCKPEKIAAVVITDIRDSTVSVPPVDENSRLMAEHLIALLESEIRLGRLPAKLPPLQSGVGGVANAVLAGLMHSNFRNLSIYSEVMQDAVLDLIEAERVAFASATALTISPERLDSFYKSLERYKYKIVLRPTEISNAPEVIRRLGIIAINTALEVDLAGNVNSTHVNGTRIMNGIGGSNDFARNAALSIFTTPSTAKNGTVSCIVPMVSHTDHTEHDVHIVITEQGMADLRGLTAYERAYVLIDRCVHPDFKDALYAYVKAAYENNEYKHGLCKFVNELSAKPKSDKNAKIKTQPSAKAA